MDYDELVDKRLGHYIFTVRLFVATTWFFMMFKQYNMEIDELSISHMQHYANQKSVRMLWHFFWII